MTELDKTTYEGEILDGRDFSRRCLLGVRFTQCSLRRCSFEASDLSYAAFEECDLYECSFRGAALYVTKFFQCDATKAQFDGALVSGVRIRDTDVTHVEFGADLTIGKNRKRDTIGKEGNGYLVCKFAEQISDPKLLEKNYNGIYCPTTHISIAFIDEGPEEQWRIHRRRSEVAKILERVLNENGYKDRSLGMYYKMRYYQTRATRNFLGRYLKIIFFEWLWGYGVKPLRPAFSSLMVALLFAGAYAALPFVSPLSGVGSSAGPTLVYSNGAISPDGVRDILVFALQVATISIYGDINPIGLGKWLAILQTIGSVVMIGLLVATVTRRIGNV